MLIIKAVVAVALAQTVTAFHPWYPDYRCAELHTCPSKRTVDASAPGSATETLKIYQNIPKSDIPHDVRVRRLAQRLSHKYQRGNLQPVVPEQQGGLAKRTNTYSVVSAAAPTASNSAPIDQDGTDFSYFTKIKFGSKGVPLNMLLDTGAGTSWVMGPACMSAPCKTHDSFGAEDSATFKDTGTSFQLNYGSGNVTGFMAEDTVSFAGLTLTTDFGIANETSDDFNNFPIDGILGLALSKGDVPTFMETLVKSKLLKTNLFGVSLSRSSDGPNTGVINFGSPDPSRFSGSLAYSPVASTTGDWQIAMSDVSFDGKAAGIEFKTAYVDTGTSYIFTTPSEVKKLHALVDGATSDDGITYKVPCTTTTDLKFTFGDTSFAVSSKDWVGPEVDGTCTSNIYGHAVVGNAWLLGDTFLKNVYAVFDVDQNRIGFAQDPPPPVTSTSASASDSATGGPTSLTKSSSALPSSDSASASGPSGTTVSSNTATTGSSSTTPAETGSPTAETTAQPPNPTAPPGMSGHQTSVTSAAEAAAESTTPSPTTTSNNSSARRLQGSTAGLILAALGLFTLIS